MIYSLAGLALAAAIGIRAHRFMTGRRLVQDVWDRWRLSTRTIFEWDAVWAQNPNRSDIIVCLTSIPSRISHIEGALKGLLYQSRTPCLVRLHVPTFSIREQRAYAIPPYLERLRAIEIVRCEDYGPATKLIPALQASDPEQKILVVDDDRLYPPDLIEYFVRWSNEHPHVAIGAAGWVVPKDLTYRRTFLSNHNLRRTPPAPLKSTWTRKKLEVDVLEGYAGYLVKPGFFDVQRITDYNGAPEAAFFVDDVWISAHCEAPKYVFPGQRHSFESWRYSRFFQRTSLNHLNSGSDVEESNNTIMIRHFEDRWWQA